MEPKIHPRRSRTTLKITENRKKNKFQCFLHPFFESFRPWGTPPKVKIDEKSMFRLSGCSWALSEAGLAPLSDLCLIFHRLCINFVSFFNRSSDDFASVWEQFLLQFSSKLAQNSVSIFGGHAFEERWIAPWHSLGSRRRYRCRCPVGGIGRQASTISLGRMKDLFVSLQLF